MLNQLIATRVAEALAAAAMTHAASTQEETNLRSNTSQNKACTYKEFCAVMQGNFQGTKGAIALTRWFEKLESQFGISNIAEGDRVKFASSTLLDSALTWWNVYVRSITLNVAHATPWNDFKAMFIWKYCPQNELKNRSRFGINITPRGNNQASTSNQGGSKAAGRIYHLCAEAAVQDNNVVNGTFLINNVYASVLFDTRADRSFMSSTFSNI
ncbi:hypothetical protein Tco_1184062 [Tanacetum coccineum]